MPQYKLAYFNGQGRAEVSRLLFHLAGVEFEDVRFELEEWPKFKPQSPFGQAPWLETDDGLTLCQSHAIARYLARKFGMAGRNAVEEAQVDMIVDCCGDLWKHLDRYYDENDPTRKAEIGKICEEQKIPDHVAGLEKLLKANKGGDGYAVGDEMTWADITILQYLTWPTMLGFPVDWSKYPKLAAHKARMESHPKIADWIKKRPVTEF